MEVLVNGEKIADDIYNGTDKELDAFRELTLTDYKGNTTIYTIDKNSRVTAVKTEGEAGNIIKVKSAEQQLQDTKEENNKLKEEIKTLKETIIEVINSIYEEEQV